MQTQLDKILDLCRDGGFKCQSQFWMISKSPHKRRADISAKYGYTWTARKCVHGIKNAFDYQLDMKGDWPQPIKHEKRYEKVQVNGEWVMKELLVL